MRLWLNLRNNGCCSEMGAMTVGTLQIWIWGEGNTVLVYMQKSCILRRKQRGFLWLYQSSSFCRVVLWMLNSQRWAVSVIKLLCLNSKPFFFLNVTITLFCLGEWAGVQSENFWNCFLVPVALVTLSTRILEPGLWKSQICFSSWLCW